MEDQLFVRIRGRVQGPFGVDKLRSLVKRGQLSRMHEVSVDGNFWKSASDYAEIFAADRRSTENHTETPKDQPATRADGASDETEIGLASETQWYFSQNNTQIGPVTFEQLQLNATRGELEKTDLVWQQGTKDWVPASSVPGISFSSAITPHPGNDDSDQPTKFDSSLTRTLKDSQAWVRFIATCIMAMSVFMIIGGMLSIVLGARAGTGTIVGGGFLMLLYSFVSIYGCCLLYSFDSRVSKSVASRRSRDLDFALRRLRTFWVLISIILIIFLFNLIVATILAFSQGLVDGPW